MKKEITCKLSKNSKASMVRCSYRTVALTIAVLLVAAGGIGLLYAKAAQKDEAQLVPMGTTKGEQYNRLRIRNCMMVTGRGMPAEGPIDIIVERGRITDIVRTPSGSSTAASSKPPKAEHVIDATGMYVMPALVDMHGQFARESAPRRMGERALEYQYRLWLGHGVTTLREPGTGGEAQLKLMVEQNRLGMENKIVAPRMVLYKSWPGVEYGNDESYTPSGIARLVRRFKGMGASGIKVISKPAWYPDVLAAICAETRKLDMRVVIDMKVSEINAIIAANAGVSTIEHFFGIPDAAWPGSQDFRYDYNNSEDARFRDAALTWAIADKYPDKVIEVLELMIKKGVAWDPTMVVYETHRDFSRAQTLPWRERYAHPLLLDSWVQRPGNSYIHQMEWTTADETNWYKHYQIWQKYIYEFFKRGGKLTVGTDPGAMQNLYGFAVIRELELLQQAGLTPLDVIRAATTNATSVLGLKDMSGIRVGNIADLIVVDGNPLKNFKVMYGLGYDKYNPDGTKEHRGGVRWTIKAGIVYDAPALLREVEWYVNQAKEGLTTSSNQ